MPKRSAFRHAAVPAATSVLTSALASAGPPGRGSRWKRGAVLVPLLLAGSVAVAAFLVTKSASALEAGKDGYFQTGTGTRKKMGSSIYTIQHSIRELPKAPKGKQALIDADVDKRLTLVYLPVPPLLKPIVGTSWPKDKVTGALREGFARNGYANQEKIDKLLAAVAQDVSDKDTLVLQYNAGSKTTTLTTKSGKATVEGAEFMQAVWSVWFARLDQPELSDALAAKWLKEK